MGRSLSLPARASANCPRCGLANADTGEGLCAECGNRLGATVAPPAIPLGTSLSGHEVVGARGDELLVRSPAGEITRLALGSESLLALEAEVLRRLSLHSPVPRPIELGRDPTYGPFLTLSLLDPAARPLAEVGRSLRVAGILPLGSQIVELAERVANEGFVWAPFSQDFHLAPGDLVALSRVRCTARLEAPGRVDVRAAFEAAGSALLPLPGALGPTRLVRLLASRVTGGASAQLAPKRAREELALVASELASPPSETAPLLTELSDRGLCRDRNEDATAVAAGEATAGERERWAVLVVGDGVSTSSSAAEASAIAARTTRDALAHFARSGDALHEGAVAAVVAAIRAAHVALCATPITRDAAEPPGTTLVAALVFGRQLVVGWVGDSRAYWIAPGGAELLTRDHSWAAEAILRGEVTEAQAMAAPLAHALTKCLGPLELSGETIEELSPDVSVRALSGPGLVILCTDGLWNYLPAPSDLASVVRAAGAGASTALIARCLVNHALARGGGDNVSVVVYRHE